MSDNDPLILTLTMDAASQMFFDELRQRHFPPARNHLDAHVTLFHALPGTEIDTVVDQLDVLANRQTELSLRFPSVRSLGRGVAVVVVCDELDVLREQLRGQWDHWLTRQDKQRLKPHVTVQNKVSPSVAQHLYAQLATSWTPFSGTGKGLSLWKYRGGPWDAVTEFEFTRSPRSGVR